MKKLMLLGGTRGLLPVIKSAHERDLYVITCDYLPNNIAHKFSDEYVNIDVTDKELVLEFALKSNINGIMSFSVDAGVTTAAYVAEKMKLPFPCSYPVAKILQTKSKFRSFLSDNGFYVPWNKTCSDLESLLENGLNYPLIIKPVDSAGSKGVSKIDIEAQIHDAFINAKKESHCGSVIIEEYIEPLYTSDSDSFVENGSLNFCTFSDQLFDKYSVNQFVPAAYVWPSSMPIEYQQSLKNELQRLMTLLNISSGIFNIETRIGTNSKAYIMEVTPRGGGNQLAEMIKYATDIDMIDAAVCVAVGDKYESLHNLEYKRNVAEIILHANKKVKTQYIPEMINNFKIEKNFWIDRHDEIQPFKDSGDTYGYAYFCTDNKTNARTLLEELVF